MTIYFDNNKKAYGEEILEYIAVCNEELWFEVCNDDDAWDIRDGVFVDLRLSEEYKEKQELKEKERVARLNMTKLDFVNALEEYSITYSQIKELLANNDDAHKQWELCERVYRFNPFLDELGAILGITSEQLDAIFINVNKTQNATL